MNVYNSKSDADFTSSVIQDIIPSSPQAEKCKKHKKFRIKQHWFCSGDSHNIHNAKNPFLMKLQNPLNSSCERVYIVHTTKELIENNSEEYQLTKYVRLIGRFRTNILEYPCIQDINASNEKFTIILHFKNSTKIPKIDEVIDVYGQLIHMCINDQKIPMLLVHFYKTIEGNIQKYITYLKIQRNYFTPSRYLQPTEDDTEFSRDSLIDFLQDLSIFSSSLEKE